MGTRRPISARDTGWARAVARRLARWGVPPNWISIGSVACGAVAGVCLALLPGRGVGMSIVLGIGAALGIQLRLLCNLFDGMVAVEGGLGSPVGELYNDYPDRLADAFVLLGAGCALREASWGLILGAVVTLLATLTAYARILGAAAGAGQFFLGPMAKQHRMAVMTVASLLAGVEPALHQPPQCLRAALILIVIGCVVTIVRRLRRIAEELRRNAQADAPQQTSLVN